MTAAAEAIPEGLALTPFDEAFRENPHPILRELRDRAPVHRDSQTGTVVLSGHDEVRKLMMDLEQWVDPRKSLPDDPIRFFSTRSQDGEPSMLFLDDPDHRRLRNLVSKSFTPRAVEHMRPLVRDVARELVSRIEVDAAGEFELMAALAAPLPAIAIAKLLGVDAKEQARFKQWSEEANTAFFNFAASEEERAKGDAAYEALVACFDREIAQRRAEPADDLIGKMVAAEEEGTRLSEPEVVTMCNLLLIAGNVTTTDLIGNGIRALVDHPSEQDKLRGQPELLANAVEEMLRFDPPVTVSGRIAPRDTEIAGYKIRKGESVTALLSAANRDPGVYPDPDRFDVSREDTHHQSFGGGAHFCLGAHLARAEAQEGIAALLERFPKLEPGSKPHVYKQVPGFRGLAEYWIRGA